MRLFKDEVQNLKNEFSYPCIEKLYNTLQSISSNMTPEDELDGSELELQDFEKNSIVINKAIDKLKRSVEGNFDQSDSELIQKHIKYIERYTTHLTTNKIGCKDLQVELDESPDIDLNRSTENKKEYEEMKSFVPR